MSFKENWEKKDEICINCKQKIVQRGLTKEHIKNLFKFKWDHNETLIFLLFLALILLSLSYQKETQTSRDWLKSISNGGLDQCIQNSKIMCEKLNLSETINNESNVIYNYSTIPAFQIK